MLELLAPAGSMEALHAAVQNGANAVYLGSGAYNARQGAKNFTPQMLAEAVKYCHIRGVAVHLTLNTLVSDRELDSVMELIRQAASVGVDAFIVQDLGVAQLCQQIAPDIALHGSTQMSVHSLAGVLFCAALGMSRVVLSRELCREDIQYICAHSPIEIEVFAHGALCMSYSGQCYLSSAIGGRSGNRGRCAQPCRQSYGYSRHDGKYPLSLKDNCLIHYLNDLQSMGVASIKLEGRMKRPEYVAAVTAVYRQALDDGNITEEMLDTLTAAFNRQGFTDGYYTGNIGASMFGVREDKYDNPNWLKKVRESYESVENALVCVDFDAEINSQTCTLTVTDPEGRKCTATGPLPQPARTTPLTQEALTERLNKTGGTPFLCKNVTCRIEDGVTLSAAAINGMRRDALNQLLAQRARWEPVKLHRPERIAHFEGRRASPSLTVQITDKAQLTGKLLRLKPEVMYVPLHILVEDPIFCHELARKVTVAAVLPRITHDHELKKLKDDLKLVKNMGVREALVGNLGLLLPVREAGLRIRGDFGLNLYNSASVNLMKDLGAKSATLSFEMTLPQIRDISKAVPCEILAYGRLPLMVTENCLIRSRTGSCTCHLSNTKLMDKTGADFPIIKDGNNCRSILLNGKKLNWLDRQKDLSKQGVWAIRLYFTTENPREVDQVLGAITNPPPFDPGSCTRGLYLRGLD